MKKKYLTVAIAACLLGIACSALSLHNYFRIQKGGLAEESSFCSVSDFVNCDVVEASSYAAVHDFPVAGFGLAYYVLILFFSLVARFSKGFKKPTVAFAWWTTLPAVLYSIVLAYISLYLLNTLCLTCIGMYLANFLLFFSLYLTMRIPFSDGLNFLWGYWATIFTRKKRGIDFMPKFGSHLLTALVVFTVVFLFVSSATSDIKKLSQADVDNYLKSFYRQSKYDIKFDEGNAALWGRKDAPVKIVEFSDYRCPYCRIAAFTIKPHLAEFKNDVAYYFINYPLDSTCNHYMQHQMHPGACLGAKGGICADKVGKYWDYHDVLFRNDGQINMKLLLSVAKKVGLDGEIFQKCIDSKDTDKILKDDIETARRIYITGTPSVFINDRQLRYWRSPEILRSVVKSEIDAYRKSKSQKN